MLFIGSCFSEHIYQRLSKLKFPYLYSNPQGILFNPLSIANCLYHLVTSKDRDGDIHEHEHDKDIFQSSLDQIFYSWQHHSDFAAMESPQILQEMMDREMKKARNILYSSGRSSSYTAEKKEAETEKDTDRTSPVIFITLGSAKVYALRERLEHMTTLKMNDLEAWKHAVVANCHKRKYSFWSFANVGC
jgi:hypothetical protein